MYEEQKFPHILYSCSSRKDWNGEAFITDHILSYIFSGKSELFMGGEKLTFSQGDFRFFRRNQLNKYVKIPPPGGEYRSISISMDEEILRSIYTESNFTVVHRESYENVLKLESNPHLLSYIQSLEPYLNSTTNLSKAVTALKVREAIIILLETNPELKDVLFDFREPGKIDLEEYMNKHFLFNAHLEHFAYLTGRSLSTFKRDFKNIFHTTPNRWLQNKRLEQACYLIKEKGKKASDIYMQVGFEDLSHFSFAFKKLYGVSPSKL